MARRAELALLLGAALLLLTGLGRTGLWAPDEPRYAHIAEEVRSLRHGAQGLVVLHLNGEVYTQKPPAYFWMAAAAGAPLGRVTEAAARLPSALAGVALVLLTFAFGQRLLGTRAGLLGAALLLTSFDFAWLARRVQLDVVLALCETAALFAFWQIRRGWQVDRGEAPRRRTLALLHAALGLAILTKGPVGFLVPLLVIATTLALERRLGSLPRLLPPWALLLSLGPALLWLFSVVSLAPPGYLEEAVGTNVFGRFFEGTSHARPFYYYFYQLPVDFLPWTLLLPAVYAVGRRHVFPRSGERDPGPAAAWTFLLAWVGVSFVFFSLSGGKRGLYLLPTFPALALLCADAWLRSVGDEGELPRPLTAALAGLGTVLALAGLAAALSPLAPLSDDVAWGRVAACGLSMIAIVVAAVVAWRRTQGPGSRIAIPLAAVYAIELSIFLLALPALDATKSPRSIAIAAAALAGPGGEIGLMGRRAMAGGLVYYADLPVEELSTPEDVGNFLAAGGRAVVVRAKHLDWVRAEVPVEVRARFREGRRALLVVSPPRSEHGADGEPAAAQASARPTDP
jgi:4-amino-4-deoxy-L-arabinose transferase-like glycosyltransferase